MSIIKNTPHILKHFGLSFTTIINQTAELIIDPATLGIYFHLASKPSDWKINELELQRRFKKGREFIERRLTELKQLGLIKTTAIKDKRGRVIRWETTLLNIASFQNTENPYSGLEIQTKKETESMSQNTGFPDPGKTRYLEKQAYTNKRKKQIKDIKKTTTVDVQKSTNISMPQDSSSSVFFSDKEKVVILELKTNQDSRSDEEFIENCEHHIENNSDKTLTKYQRTSGLKKILKSVKDCGEIFKSKGFVSKQEKIKREKLIAEREQAQRQLSENRRLETLEALKKPRKMVDVNYNSGRSVFQILADRGIANAN